MSAPSPTKQVTEPASFPLPLKTQEGALCWPPSLLQRHTQLQGTAAHSPSRLCIGLFDASECRHDFLFIFLLLVTGSERR